MNKSKLPLILFVTAEGLSLFSQAAFMLVLPWLILTIMGSAEHTSIIATIATVPAIVASLASGPIIDRIGRRRASIIATLGCAIAATGLATTAALGIINIPWLIVFGLLANTFLIPSMTARDTLMNDIATASGVALGKIAGMRQLVFSIAFLSGPGLAGLLMAHASPVYVLWLIAGLWTIAAACTRFLPHDAKRVAETEAAADGSAWRRMLHSPVILLAMFIALGTCLITAPVTDILIPAHFRALNEPQLFGWAMSILSIGSLVGAALYMIFSKAARLTYVASVVLVTISFAVLAALPGFWLLSGGLFLMGLGSSLLTPYLLVAITTHTKESERGRVMGIYNTLSLGATPVGLGLLSILLSNATLKTGFMAVLAIWLVVAAGMLIGGKKLYTVNQNEPAAADN